MSRVAKQMHRRFNHQKAAEVHYGVIAATHTSPNTVDVNLKGNTGTANAVTGVRYLASYSPAVNDHVVCVLVGSDSRNRADWLVLGVLA